MEPWIQYDKFIDVYGNKFRRQHFIAVRFKRPITSYRCMGLYVTPIEPPDNSIVVLRGPCPPIRFDKNPSVLFFSVGSDYEKGIKVTDESVNTLLRALFPPSKIVYSHFTNSTLYVVATWNPFDKITKRCRREAAFHCLVTIVEAKKNKRLLTLDEAARLRFFKRPCGKLNHFNRWSPFAFHLCRESFFPVTNALPSESTGREIFKILKRSENSPEKVHDSDFYECEIFLTDSEPVGILCAFSKDEFRRLEYVSPMVVKRTNRSYLDTRSVVCDTWMPLYKDRKTWKDYGLPFYAYDLRLKKARLAQVVSWLRIQTADKYESILKDLTVVAKILFGELKQDGL